MAKSAKKMNNHQRVDAKQEEEGLSIDLMPLTPLDKVSWTEHGGSYLNSKLMAAIRKKQCTPPDSLGF